MGVNLVVATGKHSGQTIPVNRRKFFIGRASDCKLRPSGSAVSRHHCVIVAEDDRVTVRDLGSRTGTFVNDEKIDREHPLTGGDRLRVGKWEFRVEAAVNSHAAAKAEPKPAAAKQPIDDDLDLTEWFRGADHPPEKKPDVLDDLEGSPGARESEEQPDAESEESFVRDKSEAEKQRRRMEGEIVGVSKAAQAKRTAATSQDGAAEALKKLLAGDAQLPRK